MTSARRRKDSQCDSSGRTVRLFHVENSCRTREYAGCLHICDGMQVCEGDDEYDGDERNLFDTNQNLHAD